MMVLAVLFCVVQLCSGSFLKRFPRPKERGVFRVLLKESSFEFEKVSTINPEPYPNITAWDFRLLEDSLQAQFVLQDDPGCGDSWALTSTDVAGVAAYLNTRNSSDFINEVFSGPYEVSCEECFIFREEKNCQYGCYGGYPEGIFVFMTERGGVAHSCIPKYQNSCPKECEDGSEIKFLKNSNFSIITAFNEDVSVLRDLLISSGPCIAEMYVHNDFMAYVGGVYVHPPEIEGYDNHAAVVYGYGVEDGQKYWLAKNVWGGAWGINSFFKIEMGKNDSGIEELFMCLNNNYGKGAYQNVPLPPQPKWPGAPDPDALPGSNTPAPSSPSRSPSRVWIAVVVVLVVLAFGVVGVVVFVVWWRKTRGRGRGTSLNGSEGGSVGAAFSDDPGVDSNGRRSQTDESDAV